jgi:ABC-type dipeptide/oligopeptide/nickel transport system permease subunit
MTADGRKVNRSLRFQYSEGTKRDQVGIAQGYPLPALVACACIVVVVIAVNVLGERLFEQAQRTHR